MVHIKKVDIFGFKSFGFKNTTVNFEPGLVSISGPNGSGKSNILDAIIFACGENRPKTMRVDKLRSLLHDIEGGRRGPKMTRVSLQLDNSDRKIPLDSNTVNITREMDDKGDNVYYLENKKTTRTHILDLLEVANAGLHQLNAVQQGTVTRISEFSAEEKRESIENLIGLSFFDDKKKESLKQLDDADRRLEIALARMDEIKKRIDDLEEERNFKLRYDLLEREINKLQAISASHQLKGILQESESKEKTVNSINSEVKKLDGERSILRKQIHEVESEKNSFLEKVNAFNQAKATIDSEISSTMQKFESSSSALATSKRRLDQIIERLPEIHQEIEKISESKKFIFEQVEGLRKSIKSKSEEKRKLNEDIKLLDSELKKTVMKRQSQVSANKIEMDKKVRTMSNQLNSAKLSFSKINSEISDIENKINLNLSKKNNLEGEKNSLEKLKKRLDTVTSNHTASMKEIKSRLEKLESKKLKASKDLEDLSLILEKASKAAARYETKIKMVKGILHEDYSIAKLKEESDSLGIEGLVYEKISWDKIHERPVLAVCSDWLKSIIVKDFETLLTLANFVIEKKLPKVKIIPLNAIPKFNLSYPENENVMGVLSDFIKCEKKFENLKTFLFGNVLLVNARNTAHQYSQNGFKAVTLDGEFFEANENAVVVDVNSKISKLTKIISLSTSVDGLVQSISLLKKFINNKKNQQQKLEKLISKYNDRLSLSETGLANSDLSYNNLMTKMKTSNNFQNQLETRNSHLSSKLERLKSESMKQESYVLSLEERISLVNDNYTDGEQKRIAHELSILNDRRSEIISNQTQILTEFRDLESQLSSQVSADNTEKNKLRILHEERVTLKREQTEHESKIKTLEKEKDLANEDLIALRTKEQDLISTSGTSVTQLKDYDENLKQSNEKEKSLTREINSFERQTDSINRDLKELHEKTIKIRKLLETFGFDETQETFDVDFILKELESERKALVSSINTKAPETYVEISDGYRSMSTRKNELEEERNSIVKFIEEIDKDKRQTFLDAFDKVDREIREAFATMTGGNAWLELQNEDDIFSSGISYLIQFPNKPKRESTSISGGEKTLAAIVFVLALQKLKPSPFYLFDEVDAHLDAPNSERLSKIIEQRSKGSQFIMVSLKDSVVQKAKLIYGVYPKNGVSNVVTYKDRRVPSLAT